MFYEFQHRSDPTVVLAVTSANVASATHAEPVTTVEIDGPGAPDVVADQRTNTVVIRAKRQSWTGPSLLLKLTVPDQSSLVGRMGNGRLTATGMLKSAR